MLDREVKMREAETKAVYHATSMYYEVCQIIYWFLFKQMKLPEIEKYTRVEI